MSWMNVLSSAIAAGLSWRVIWIWYFSARTFHLGEHHVGPREAVHRDLHPEPRPGPAPVGILARQPPVDQVVVAELRVVGDVGEVLEDLLARAGDRHRDGDRVHRGGSLC